MAEFLGCSLVEVATAQGGRTTKRYISDVRWWKSKPKLAEPTRKAAAKKRGRKATSEHRQAISRGLADHWAT
ncbi:MAG: hypothetical protein ACREA0_33600, partial [bacterium]